MPEQNYGGNVQISCVMPKVTSSVSKEILVSSVAAPVGPQGGGMPGQGGGMPGMLVPA